jgi:gluconate 2-dehydrogenase gamma chain
VGSRGRRALSEMQRRRLLELTALATGALSLHGCHSARAPLPAERSPGFDPTLFTREQALCAEDLAEIIIPEGETPGARSAGVAAFIESFVRDVYEEPQQRAFLGALEQLAARALEQHARPFFACTPAEQSALFFALAAESAPSAGGPPFFFARSFRELCIRGYCSSRLGATRVLQYEPTPGEFQGCVPLASIGKAWATW